MSGDEQDDEQDHTDIEPVDGEELDADPVLEERDRRLPGDLTIVSASSGPLPPESWIQVAEQYAPGTTEKLVDDYIAQRKHGRTVERRAAKQDEVDMKSFSEYQNTQLAGAIVIALVIAVGGIALAFTDHSIYGLAVLVAEISGLILAFLYGRSHRRQPPAEGQ